MQRARVETFVDLVGATVHEITLNGTAVNPATAYADSRIALSGLAADNELVVRADCTYSRGEGLHRFVDPADDRVYLYSQFEVPDARRVFTTFEQPDLKSTYTFNVTRPRTGRSCPTLRPPSRARPATAWPCGASRRKRMSTYITALVAGEYHEVLDTYAGQARRDLAGPLLPPVAGRAPRPRGAGQADQAGLRVLRGGLRLSLPVRVRPALRARVQHGRDGERRLRDAPRRVPPRSRQDRSFYEFRCSVILHEMAHMWFGDLVTMRWWDDLWLNEVLRRVGVLPRRRRGDRVRRVVDRLHQRAQELGLPPGPAAQHPVAADNHDLQAVEVNFDGITYAKGASILKQLVAWVGLENFLSGLGEYFREHAYDSAEFADLLGALGGRRAASCRTGRTSGCRPRASTRCTPSSPSTARAATPRSRSSRRRRTTRRCRHRIGIGLYDEVDGRLVRRSHVEVDIHGASTEIADLSARSSPTCCCSTTAT